MSPQLFFSDDFPLDRHFARMMCSLEGREDPALFLAALAVSRYSRQGHICTDLAEWAGREVAGIPSWEGRRTPDLARWRESLAKSRVVGKPGAFAPLILDDAGRLYLHRYWRYERDLAACLRRRLTAYSTGGMPDLKPPVPSVPVLKAALERLFPERVPGAPDFQWMAALTAAVCPICIVSGSPGTGKTTAVAKMLALLLETAGPGNAVRIALAAPTGKAAGRLEQALNRSRDSLPCPQWVRDAIPRGSATLHRLLGSSYRTSRVRYSRQRPLPADILVIDEASMVDLPLMARTLEALPERARLILLGDRDQLASVDAGAVLGDICNAGPMNTVSEGMRAALGALATEFTPNPRQGGQGEAIGDGLVELKRNFRFRSDGGIGLLSDAVRKGDSERALACLRSGSNGDVRWRVPPVPAEFPSALGAAVREGFRDYLSALRSNGDVDAILESLDRFRILCAVRQGPWGVEAVNLAVERILRSAGLPNAGGRRYPGRPIMILRNDYTLGLFNGDTGVLMADPEGEGKTDRDLYAYFRDDHGALKKIDPLRLPEHETVFATTVHKSQGSECERILFLMPDRDFPLLTRELIYTAVTRARKEVEVWAREEIFCAALSRKINRISGLADALRSPVPSDRG